MSNVRIPRGMVRAVSFQGELAGIDSSVHVSFEGDDKLDALLINGKEHLAVEEAPVDDQGTDGAFGADVLLGLL